MLTLGNLKESANKNQTGVENIVREYVQQIFLSSLYKIKGSERLFFKGGTALRIIYGSPRFSEDLDFDGQNIRRQKLIDDLFIETISKIEAVGIAISLREAKQTSGGYLGIISYNLYDVSGEIKFEISLRNGGAVNYETTTIVSDYLLSYSIIHSPAKKIVFGKMGALFNRGKPRDYYDFYFILRHPELRKFVSKDQMKMAEKSLNKVGVNFKKELSVLLPVSHHSILRDFKKTLSREIRKYL